jgi:uncharacterized protein
MSRARMPVLLIALVVVLGLAAALFSMFRAQRGPLASATVTIRPPVGAAGRTGDHTFRVDLARTMLERSQGLSGRGRLGDDEGMYFIFDSPAVQGFWMKDMLFAIDIVWVLGDRVVGFRENAQPEPGKSIFTLPVYYSPEPVDRVLEVNAGTVAKYGIEIGDTVEFAQN